MSYCDCAPSNRACNRLNQCRIVCVVEQGNNQGRTPPNGLFNLFILRLRNVLVGEVGVIRSLVNLERVREESSSMLLNDDVDIETVG